MSTLPSVNLNNLYAAFGSSASGIDVASAVSQILDADRACERQWQAQQSDIDQQTSALNQLSSLASSLSDKLNALQDPAGALMATNVTSTDSAVISATAAAGTPSGTHVVSVQNLATTASWYSDAVTSGSTAFTPGSFDLTVGSGSSQKTVTIVLGNGVNTPQDLANSVNGLNLGITASVITDAKGTRVAMVSTASGSAADFSIQPTDTNAPNLFTRAATGNNASLTVDGVPISSASNTVSSVISGVTLNLKSQAPGSEVVLTVGPDTNSAAQAVNDFVTYFNALVHQVNSQFAYNATNQTSGPLSNDSMVRMLQSELLAAPSYSGVTGAFTTLGSLGVTMNDDGTLTADSAALSAALQNNPSAVQSFFQGTSSNGFAASLKSALDSFADPSDGSFTVDLKSLSNTRSGLQDQIDNYEDYLAGVQTSLTAKYNQANILLLQLPTLEKQIDALLGNNSNGSNG